MNQEKVWDNISKRWYEYRKIKEKGVSSFLKGKSGKLLNKSFASSKNKKLKSEPAKLLDVGCGSGRNFVNQKGLEIYGIDFSVKMLELAGEEARRIGARVILKKGKSEKIPFKDEFFDYAICVAVLHCVDTDKKRKRTLKEIYRVLKNGGLAYISVWSRGGPRLSKIKEIVTSKVNECFIPWTVGEKKYPRYTYLFNAVEMKKMLEDAGFGIVSFEDDGRNLNFVVRK